MAIPPHIRLIGEEKPLGPLSIYPARRWVVERTFAWLKGFRAVRTRYTCKGANYLALLHLACSLVLARRLETVS